MSSESHEVGPLEPAAVVAPAYKRSWREKRWERRHRRRMAEEALGWILVPIILILAFWGLKALLNALGTSPSALIQGVKAVLGS
jgi:hypothetical protein